MVSKLISFTALATLLCSFNVYAMDPPQDPEKNQFSVKNLARKFDQVVVYKTPKAQSRPAETCEKNDSLVISNAETKLDFSVRSLNKKFEQNDLDHDRSAQYFYALQHEAKDPAVAFKFFKLSGADIEVGRCYAEGKGTEQNFELAFKHYKRAADHWGGKAIQNIVADCYEKGIGTTKNRDKMFSYRLRAAETGSKKAQYAVGYIYWESYVAGSEYLETAREYFKFAAKKGHAKAQCMVGVCYDQLGTEQHFKKAFKYYKRSVAQGFEPAQYCVAQCYDKGRGTKQDHYLAFKYYKLYTDQVDRFLVKDDSTLAKAYKRMGKMCRAWESIKLDKARELLNNWRNTYSSYGTLVIDYEEIKENPKLVEFISKVQSKMQYYCAQESLTKEEVQEILVYGKQIEILNFFCNNKEESSQRKRRNSR